MRKIPDLSHINKGFTNPFFIFFYEMSFWGEISLVDTVDRLFYRVKAISIFH